MAPSAGPTIRTVAAEAGVSVATVSYVLSGRADRMTKVSAPTRARVQDAATRLGYQPNQFARGMRRGKTGQVCLSLSHLDTPWSRAMAEAISATLERYDYTTIILAKAQGWDSYLRGRGADGAFIDSIQGTPDELAKLHTLANRGVALVLFTLDIEPNGFDVVSPRRTAALAEAMDYLASRHHRIAFVRMSRPALWMSNQCFEAYAEGLARAGVVMDPSLVVDAGRSAEQAYRLVRDRLKGADRPTAILASTDEAALAALRAAHRLGISVPGELEIIGCDNSVEGQEADPPLSTVGPESIFDDVAKLLLTRLLGEAPDKGRKHVVPWRLHQRGTTRPG